MKQFQFDYHSITSLTRDLEKVRLWYKSKSCSNVVFQIYSDSLDRGQMELVSNVITRTIPHAICMGCSTNGNIIEGRLSSTTISVVCTILEKPSTKVKLLQYTLNGETALDVVENIKREVRENPWVKGVELQLTIRGMSLSPLCDALHDVDESIAIFGGGAFNPDLSKNDACVFSNVGGYSERGILVLLIGGEDLHIYTTHIAGWKPLGREFLVTKAQNALLFELDGKPAYEIYYRYLKILNDEHFFANTLEFPFFYKHNGIDILRAPVHCNEDGTLVMTSDIDENVKARLAYGDPWTILDCIRKDGKKIGEFKPDIIKVFSCAARRSFWGKEEISNETLPFQSIAPTSGFYTAGEFLRTNGFVNQHNVTLVIAAMREGDGDDSHKFDMAENSFSGQVSMINRLATFIDAATQELAQANAKLSLMAITDPLSHLFNRGEIQRCIKECISEKTPACLVMMDIDDFKKINDTYGHKEGDNVIIGISNVLKKTVDETGLSGIDSSDYRVMEDDDDFDETSRGLRESILTVKSPIGRWGGEEFMVLLRETPIEKALDFAEKVRKAFNEMEFEKAGHRSVSVGVVEIQEGESADSAYVRVDQALYKAKENGRNQVFYAQGGER